MTKNLLSMKNFITLLIFSFCAISAMAQWQPDILGDDYQMRYIHHANDYSGPVRSSIIKKTSLISNGIGVLYIHGYNDYFFQKELGDQFTKHGINFYATDLRKYGRSIVNRSTMFEVRDLSEYYADIDSALYIMKADGISNIFIMGHSTGGLIATLYVKNHPDKTLKGLILNSPFYEWNMSKFMKYVLIPIVGAIGNVFPNISIPQGENTAYGESLLKDFHGEWEYNRNWKLMQSPPVRSGWLQAINKAHDDILIGERIKIPILLMHSDKSIYGNKWDESFNCGDAVLNVQDISIIGKRIGYNITEAIVVDGLHDLTLSRKDVRNAVYCCIFRWINGIIPLLH